MIKHTVIPKIEKNNIFIKENENENEEKMVSAKLQTQICTKVNESLLLYIDQVNTNSFKNIVRDFRGKKLIDYLSTVGKFTSLQKEVLIGLLLGDGSIQSNGGKNFFFKFDQKGVSQAYVSLVYLIFQPFVGNHPKLRFKNGVDHSWWFRTYRLPFLKFYHDQFYGLDAHGSSIRIVPKLLHRWITPISLAFWFMDDGGKGTSGYNLHTQCFSLHHVKNLQKVLGNKFGLEVSIHSDTKKGTQRKYYYLYISSGSVQKFTELVKPYIIPCMQYKLHDFKISGNLETAESSISILQMESSKGRR
jgi:hypothetical protein